MNLVDIEVRKREQEEHREKKARKTRIHKLRVAGFGFTLLLLLLFGRISYIKMVHGETYERIALANQYNRNNLESVINPNRGNIVDRNNQTLAVSYTVYNIILDIRMLVNESADVQAHTVEVLHRHLGIPEYELRNLLFVDVDGKPIRNTRYHILKTEVPRSVRNDLMDERPRFVYDEMATMRDYVHGNVASQIIGFIRGDSRWGLEAFYEHEMSGQEGRTIRYFDSRGNPMVEQKDPIDGYTLVTTLDTNIQRICEEAALAVGLEYDAQNTLVAAMNPMTGELLAMAQYPTFDLNVPDNKTRFTNYRVTVDEMGNLIEPDASDNFDSLFAVWKNYGIATTFEPGSTFKAMVVAAALEERVISRHDTFHCGGYIQLYDQTIPCWIYQYGGSTHGQLTLTEVLSHSCNMGMIAIAQKMGRDSFHKYRQDFGFGEVTGIDLPGEVSARHLIHSLGRMGPVEVAAASIGQGFNATAMQVMTAFGAVINGGDLMRPYVVSQVVDRNGVIVKENRPTVMRKVVSQDTSKFMRDAMVQTLHEGGTGQNAHIMGYNIGGKTGTGQQGRKGEGGDDEHVLSFIAYLPSENPDIMVMVLIDRPSTFIQGTTSPVPTLQSVLQRIITYKAIPPAGVESGMTGVLNNSITIEDYIGGRLRDVSRSLNAKDIDFESVGNGDRIINQSPKPGQIGDADTLLILYLGESGDDVDLVLLPNVRNASIETATSILQNAGFAVSTSIESKASTMDIDNDVSAVITVYAQFPSGDIKIERGTEIRLKAQ